ncbi:hypothetical protein KAOT1_01999 [Kordia algicida OT-1]|uniref:Uncharacterized protein n=1 Tax=Kordia algicida OT-1 TaxID=391587 RepID=A9E6Q3_9FLAO|nr:hypothetical protein KAOT1_01999 [Kordia algicida OT-1]
MGFKAIIYDFLGYLNLLKKNEIIKFSNISELLKTKKALNLSAFI